VLPLSASAKKGFDSAHVYSQAPEAAKKRAIDLQIIGGDYSRGSEVSKDNESYLKSLIEIASGGKQRVGADAKKRLHFYIIRGGGEGFLPPSFATKDAGDFVQAASTTSGASGITFHFDMNDLLVVFDKAGKFVSSALLQRPTSITGVWSKETAQAVYDAWDSKEVFISKNTNFEIPYLGLGVADGFRKKHIVVDMHKQEDTNGCIFILDPNTPVLDHDDPTRPDKLGKFEPQLIKDVLAAIGKTPADIRGGNVALGIMHRVDI
jgi:hypothetical protein